MPKVAFVCFLLLALLPAWSQRPQGTSGTSTSAPVAATPRVDETNHVDAGKAYYRVYAVVPIIGAGTSSDPKRPMFAPAPNANFDHSTSIIGFQMQLSDDHTMALVEFVGANRAALLPIITTTDVTSVVFERGKTTKATIEAEFQKYKKGFTLDSWTPVRPQ
jgi:hypothetical protein